MHIAAMSGWVPCDIISPGTHGGKGDDSYDKRTTDEALRRYAELLKAAAKEISQKLG